MPWNVLPYKKIASYIFSNTFSSNVSYLCMKKQIAILTFASAAQMIFAQDLKLELIAPKEAFTIKKEHVAALETLDQDQKNLQSAMQDEKADPKKIDEWSAKIEKARAIQQGMHLTLRITNKGSSTKQLYYGADTSRNVLSIEGEGAVFLAYRGMMTMEYRTPEPTEIKAGESKEFVIQNLSGGVRDMDRWFITKPGKYRATCQLIISNEEKNQDETPPQLRTETISFDVKLADEK